MINDLQSEPITQVLDAYKAAVFAKDVDAFVALYDEDVCVFDMWGRWSYDGLEAWREMVMDWFGSLGTERVEVSFDEVQTTMMQTLGVQGAVAIYAFVTYQGLSAEGEALRAMTNRLTWALGWKAGVWKIVHEHSSAPADFETLKVNLGRE